MGEWGPADELFAWDATPEPDTLSATHPAPSGPIVLTGNVDVARLMFRRDFDRDAATDEEALTYASYAMAMSLTECFEPFPGAEQGQSYKGVLDLLESRYNDEHGTDDLDYPSLPDEAGMEEGPSFEESMRRAHPVQHDGDEPPIGQPTGRGHVLPGTPVQMQVGTVADLFAGAKAQHEAMSDDEKQAHTDHAVGELLRAGAIDEEMAAHLRKQSE